MILDLRHKVYRHMDRGALAEIALFCKQEFGINIFKKWFVKDVIVLDYYTGELSTEALEALDVQFNKLFNEDSYLVYSNIDDKPRICCKAEQLWDFTSDGKNPNIWFYHAILGTIAWNCRTGCTLVRPATPYNLSEYD